MAREEMLFSTLAPLVASRVFPDVAPEKTGLPYITYQEIGGVAINFLDQAMPSKANARVQVSVWAATRSAANALGLQVEAAMRAAALQTEVLGAAVGSFDEVTKLRGTRQDFSIWFDT